MNIWERKEHIDLDEEKLSFRGFRQTKKFSRTKIIIIIIYVYFMLVLRTGNINAELKNENETGILNNEVEEKMKE